VDPSEVRDESEDARRATRKPATRWTVDWIKMVYSSRTERATAEGRLGAREGAIEGKES